MELRLSQSKAEGRFKALKALKQNRERYSPSTTVRSSLDFSGRTGASPISYLLAGSHVTSLTMQDFHTLHPLPWLLHPKDLYILHFDDGMLCV